MQPNSFDNMTVTKQEIKEQQIKLKLERDKISQKLEELEKEFTELLQQAMDSDDLKQNMYKQKIKKLKQKQKLKEKKKKKNTEDLAAVILIGGAQKLVDRCDTNNRDIDSILADPAIESDDVTESIWDFIEEYDLDYGIVAKVQDELDLDLIDIKVERQYDPIPIPEDPRPEDGVDVEIEEDLPEEIEEFDFNL